jgi:4-hydroxy-3-methylbut-2-en-1-yl diphosphate synthase IspG/GcpE
MLCFTVVLKIAIYRKEKVMLKRCPDCGRIINEESHICTEKKDKYLDDYEKDKGADAYDSGGDYGDGEDLA